MKTRCIECPNLVPVGTGGRCPLHRLPAKKIRSTYAWTKRSREARATGVCARCGRVGVPLQADHVISLKRRPDLALTGPVQALCHDCHRLKTKADSHFRTISAK